MWHSQLQLIIQQGLQPSHESIVEATASAQDDGGPSLLQRLLNVGKRCVGVFAKSSPPEPNPEAGLGLDAAPAGSGGKALVGG